MVDFMLDDLSRPAGKGLDAGLEFFVLPLHLDGLKPLTGPWATQERKTTFFRIVRPG